MRWRQGIGGFTLLEVLVALLIVAIAVGALARAGGQVLSSQAALEERTLALWVADNLIAELRLEPPARSGRRQGTSSQGGRDWYWDILIQPTPGEELIRIDIAVHAAADRRSPVLTHTGFLPASGR